MSVLGEWVAARRPLWAIYPTRRFAWLVLAASILWLVPVGGGVVALAGLAALIMAAGVDFILLPGRTDLLITRDIPPTLGLGDRVDARIALQSRWRGRVKATITHELPSSFQTEQNVTVHVDPHATVSVPLDFTPMRRGPVTLGDMALRVTTRLDLLSRIVRSPLGGESVVVPSLANVRRFRLMALQHRLRDVGIRALKRRGEGRSFAGLREYVPGDDPRTIDWKATARHQHLMAREFTVERSQTVIALVDCGRAMTQMAGEFARIEHVLSAAMLLTDVAAVSGDQVGALAFDEQVRAYVPAQRGRAALGS
ncbi:MAG TPA: DUF58 domain-containing protein, partial [Gemmatimonadaceae bacterium]